MMVWQSEERNEWATAIQQALGASPPPSQLDPFSLADAPAVESLLAAAGFTDVAFADVREPVYYGSDASAALELVPQGIREQPADRVLKPLAHLPPAWQYEHTAIKETQAGRRGDIMKRQSGARYGRIIGHRRSHGRAARRGWLQGLRYQ